MIDIYQLRVLREIRRMSGPVLCLGDQRPSRSTGFSTSSELFLSLGYTEVVDVDYNGLAKINHDLNIPLPEAFRGRFALVYDGGTCEHVCNIGQAFRSMAESCAVGGHVLQESPVVPYGQAYYGIDPQVQRDFFGANGFTRVKHLLHYRRSARMSVLHAVCRILPRRHLDRLRSFVSGIRGAKDFIFADLDDTRTYPDHVWDRECYYVHPQTRSLYLGRKVISCDHIEWPAMGCYPRNQ